MLRSATIAFGIIVLAATTGKADQFYREAKSGVSMRMKVYTSWNNDCSSREGIVRVVTKPQSGRLTPTKIATTIPNSRFGPGSEQCKGLPTAGFNVDYRSNPGFHGQDQFVLDVTFGTKRQVLDTFIVDVR